MIMIQYILGFCSQILIKTDRRRRCGLQRRMWTISNEIFIEKDIASINTHFRLPAPLLIRAGQFLAYKFCTQFLQHNKCKFQGTLSALFGCVSGLGQSSKKAVRSRPNKPTALFTTTCSLSWRSGQAFMDLSKLEKVFVKIANSIYYTLLSKVLIWSILTCGEG